MQLLSTQISGPKLSRKSSPVFAINRFCFGSSLVPPHKSIALEATLQHQALSNLQSKSCICKLRAERTTLATEVLSLTSLCWGTGVGCSHWQQERQRLQVFLQTGECPIVSWLSPETHKICLEVQHYYFQSLPAQILQQNIIQLLNNPEFLMLVKFCISFVF